MRSDFNLFGIQLWTELKRRYPSRAARWQWQLSLLNAARNGIAHDDWAPIAHVAANGWLLTLPFVHRWWIGLDGLATGLDHVVGEYLHRTFGVKPW